MPAIPNPNNNANTVTIAEKTRAKADIIRGNPIGIAYMQIRIISVTLLLF